MSEGAANGPGADGTGTIGPGTIVAGRYEIGEMLGEGGMGSVWEATQIALRRPVALKVIHPEKAARSVSRERFLREARVASSIKHGGVVDIYDYGEHAGVLYLAMERLSGPDLRSIVDVDLPPVPLARAVGMAAEIADVLAAAEAAAAVHRDLKPENVIFDVDSAGRERVVLVDFGLAFLAEETDRETGRLTREGVITGTPEYMAPEQCRGEAVMTPAVDVYALGVMLYELLTAHTPFEGDAAMVISRHLFVKPKPIRDAYPEREVPGAIDDLIGRMMAKEPGERPAARQVRDFLRGFEPAAPARMSGRGEDATRLGRAARMISVGATTERPPPTEAAEGVVVAWEGPLDDDGRLALAANGLEVVMLEAGQDAPEGVAALMLLGASVGEVEARAAAGLPVIADAPKGDVARLSGLLRAGAAEVVVHGGELAPEDVARKVWRAVRKARRR
ncbi:MAG TPA: serine/threonine-protein kinase [Polyangiaceae bacterium LLY-WYZ-15_(1-7)]|nr:hypothetical protein [Sandaracinus sp.]HJL06823.1 serine/threonine-protein kinase [Polyangiaceae bacterium LLY-WYZ-15_(1-7)]MBJ74465.1 hypothetical protein [Sandaracinus sp.]HJL12631.1 serine/threonine-protein kinase [Polyangiaceae bacterium LLY-WYZ-15_(1-7)]HJL21653.1 serine/threonine-protein kinase [Polyangiaceae bacterium LLY-WYZ-15_(1-7)]